MHNSSQFSARSQSAAQSGGEQSAVPLFALAPQDYITKIGQYLLTLPQNFEPFTMQENSNLVIALQKAKLPYLNEQELSDDLTACWLDSIANATYASFSDEVLKIVGPVSVNSQRQLIIDIGRLLFYIILWSISNMIYVFLLFLEYICSVFDDVGLKDYSNLNNVLSLLKADSKEKFDEASKNLPARTVSAVRKMRGL